MTPTTHKTKEIGSYILFFLIALFLGGIISYLLFGVNVDSSSAESYSMERELNDSLAKIDCLDYVFEHADKNEGLIFKDSECFPEKKQFSFEHSTQYKIFTTEKFDEYLESIIDKSRKEGEECTIRRQDCQKERERINKIDAELKRKMNATCEAFCESSKSFVAYRWKGGGGGSGAWSYCECWAGMQLTPSNYGCFCGTPDEIVKESYFLNEVELE